MWQVSYLCFLILLSGVWSCFFVCNIFYYLTSLSKSVCFFVLIRSATSDSIERMALWRRYTVGPNCHHNQVLQECSLFLCWLCVPSVVAMTWLLWVHCSIELAWSSIVTEACVQPMMASWYVNLPLAWLSVGPAVTAVSMLMGWDSDSVWLAARPVCDYCRYTGMSVTCPAWLTAGSLHDSCWCSVMECRPLFWLAVRPGLYSCKCIGVQSVIAPTWGTIFGGGTWDQQRHFHVLGEDHHLGWAPGYMGSHTGCWGVGHLVGRIPNPTKTLDSCWVQGKMTPWMCSRPSGTTYEVLKVGGPSWRGSVANCGVSLSARIWAPP